MKINKTDMVKHFIELEIKAGRIKGGQRLPSCRDVASKLSINKITVNKAYSELERGHVVYSIPRGGYYLMDIVEQQRPTQQIVDFRTVKPDEKLIPYREFTHVMNKAVDMYQRSLFGYETTGGLEALKVTLKQEFERDGVYTSSDRIIITHGAQQAIYLVLQALFKDKVGKKLLVEAPTYSLALKLAGHLGIEVRGIERKREGFDFKYLERTLKSGEIIAFYVIAQHHNPTGYNLSERDKQRVVELCNRYKVHIIEDDYLADLGSKKGSMPIHYYDTNKSTIYIRSFSKTFMPGIRLGAAVLPNEIIDEVLGLKHMSDLNTSKLPQAALDIFIKSGLYERHIKRVRKSYEEKLKKSAEIFKALDMEGINYHIPQHGIFIWLQLPSGIKAANLEKEMEQEGILIRAADDFFPPNWIEEGTNSRGSFIRLCISGVSKEKLDALAKIIAPLVRKK